MQGFMQFWGVVFIVVTVLIGLLKTEKKEESRQEGESEASIAEVYRQTWQVLRIPRVRHLCMVLLTWKLGFAASDALFLPKLLERGMAKEHIALMSSAMTPLMILVTAAVSKMTSGPRPLDLAMKVYPVRIGFSILSAVLMFVLPDPLVWVSTAHQGGVYVVLMVLIAAQGILMTVMFAAQMAFFAQVSDPEMGGTYMVRGGMVALACPSVCAGGAYMVRGGMVALACPRVCVGGAYMVSGRALFCACPRVHGCPSMTGGGGTAVAALRRRRLGCLVGAAACTPVGRWTTHVLTPPACCHATNATMRSRRRTASLPFGRPS